MSREIGKSLLPLRYYLDDNGKPTGPTYKFSIKAIA
jgi:hypothetical protein